MWSPETRRGKSFMTGAAEQIQHILGNFKSYQVWIGENTNPDDPVMIVLKGG